MGKFKGIKSTPVQGIKVDGAVVKGVSDFITQPLYDTIDLVTGVSTDLNYFSVPVGQDAKTDWHTNMKQASMLPLTQAFRLRGFSMTICDPDISAADYLSMMVESQSFLTFTLLEKEYLKIPLYFLPVYNFSYNQERGAAVPTNFVIPSTNVKYYQMRRYIDIEGQMAFSVVVKFENNLALTKVYPVAIYMHGTLNRAVQ